MSLSIPDIGYSPFKGNRIVSLWRELALNRVIEVEAFTTERACKIRGCDVMFKDPVLALKHIWDEHLPKKRKTSLEVASKPKKILWVQEKNNVLIDDQPMIEQQRASKVKHLSQKQENVPKDKLISEERVIHSRDQSAD